MAFNTKEQEIIKYGLENGKSKEEVQQAITNYRLGITPSKTEPKQGLIQETAQDIGQTGAGIKNVVSKRMKNIGETKGAFMKGEQGVGETALQAVGQTAGLVSDIFGEVVKGGIKTILPQGAETAIKTGAEKVITPIAQTELVKGIIQKYNSLDEKTKRDIDAGLGIGSLGLDIATLGVGKKAGEVAVEQGVKGAIKTGELATQLGEDIYSASRTATAKIAEKLKAPKPTPIEAVGEVLQGKTKDIKAGIKGLSAIDTTGVKTYSDLDNQITKNISTLAEKVDADLALDQTKKTLKDLTISAKTTGGKIVKYNPVERAITQLEELYTKIGDNVEAGNMRELLNTAKKDGLTNLEVNDIARVYGVEFGSKAFGKLGEPLTSVNAQLYENTRKALKDIARSGIKGSEAKSADETISNLYKVQTLVKKNVEAVNKLEQKIRERGLFEKVGYNVAKYGDILTGGSLRGIIGGLLPRGAGYKVMNAVDIEARLEENLKIIQEAIKAGNDKEIIKLLNKTK